MWNDDDAEEQMRRADWWKNAPAKSVVRQDPTFYNCSASAQDVSDYRNAARRLGIKLRVKVVRSRQGYPVPGWLGLHCPPDVELRRQLYEEYQRILDDRAMVAWQLAKWEAYVPKGGMMGWAKVHALRKPTSGTRRARKSATS